MVWKTTLAFLFNIIKIELLKKRLRVLLLLLIFSLSLEPVYSQDSASCDIDVVGCPPTDIVEKCGDVLIGDILGNYVHWTEPDYSLDCGDENGYQYEISFDLPESQEECWTFSKVQRVGNNGGTLQLWQSTGTTVNPIVTSPSFFINEVMEGSMDILTPSGESFMVKVYLLDPNGTSSSVLDTFRVDGNSTLQSYAFILDPANFNGTGDYDGNVFRIRFEFVPITPISNGTKKYVELITLDAGLFGTACAAEANFAVTKTHNPGDFFPTGTTTVTYTATCNGCVPAIPESCSFNVVVDPMPAIPVTAKIVQPNCESTTGTFSITTVKGLTYSFNDGEFGSTTSWTQLAPDTYTVKARNSEGCISNPLSVTITEFTDTTAPTPDAASLADVTAQCEVTELTEPTAIDNCDGTVSVSHNATLPINAIGTTVVTWTFEDAAGNTATQTQNVIIEVTTAPTPDAAFLADVTAQCEVTELTEPTATDNCGGTVSVSHNATLPINANGTTVVIWTFEDAAGNTATQSQNVIITDTTAPTPNAASLADVTAQCEVTELTMPTATDNCGGTVSVSHNATLPITASGTTVVTWTFEDAAGNIATQDQNVIISDTSAPAPDAASLADVTAQCEVTELAAPTATDNCGGTVSVSHNATLPINANGTTVVIWTFEDAAGNTATQSQNVIITDTTAPTPDAAFLADVTAQCEVTELTEPTATDNCGGTVSVSHNATLPINANGTTVVIWTFEDAAGNTATQSQNVIITDTTAPTPDAASLADVTAQCEVTELTMPTATDNCGGTVSVSHNATLPITTSGTTVVTWTFEDAAGNTATQTQNVIITDTTAPEAVTLQTITGNCEVTVTAPTTSDNCAGTITGTTSDPLTYSELGSYEITWTFDDNNGNITTAKQQIIVQNTTAPVAPVLADAIAECEITVSVPTTTNTCTGETIEGTTSDPLTYTEQGEYEILWTFNDGNGNSTTATQDVIVNDTTAPEAITIADAIGNCEVTVTAPTTSDNCAGTITGTTSDPLTYSELGSYEITWTFDDNNGNTTTAVQNVVVDDVTAPEAITIADATGECEVTVTAPTTSDNCTGTITGTTSDALTYTEQGSYKVTWTFDDENGNTTTSVQNVIVDDVTTPSEITIVEATGECEVTVTTPSTSDNCAGTIKGTTSDPLTYTEQGSYEVTWTFDDGNGNITTSIQNVIVDDVTAPEAITIADATGECEVTVTAPTTSDNCAGTITGTTSEPLTYTEQGNYEVTWTFDDGNGNTTTSVQNVIVDDVTAPEAITIADATGECEVTVTAPSTSDNCTGTITGTTSDPLTYTEQGEYEITWSFNDGNGNITTSIQNVIVDDVTAPEAITIADATGECEVTVTAPTTSDNCAGTITGTTSDPLTYSEIGTYEITWTFDDQNGNTTTAKQQVVVQNTTAPVAPVLADAVAECEITVAVPSTTNACTGETIEGTTTDPLTYTVQGKYEITWTFDDGDGNVVTSTQNVVVDDVTAPEAITIADATGECEVTVTAPTTSDNCAGTITGTTSDPLTYTEQGEYEITWTFDDQNGNTTTAKQQVVVQNTTAPVAPVLADAVAECEITVPVPSTTNACTGETIEGTTTDPLTYTVQGKYEITWTFDDGDGNVVTSTQNVVVDDVTAPEAVTIADATGECEVTVTAPTTSDNCAGTITGTTSDPLTYTEQGSYQISWTFNDGNGNTTTSVQNVIVDDVTAPAATTIADATGGCEVTVTVPTTSDNCGGTVTGTTSDPLTYTEQGNYEITWSFDDGNGNTTTSVQNVIVDDVTAPAATTIADATGECEVTVTVPTTSDNCGGTVIGTTSDPVTYNEQGSYQISWTFNDGNGNTTTSVQNVIVDDVTAPAATTIADATGECEVTVTAPTTSDNCAGTITGTTSDPLTYTEQGNYEVTWTFDDGNGNITTAVQNVIVDGLSAPVVSEVIQPNCEVTTGSITVSTVEGLEYTIDGENYTASGSFESLQPGIYTVAAINEAGCLSPLTEVTMNETTGLSAPEIATTVQPTCELSTGSLTVVGEEGISYSIDGTNYQAEVEFTNLTPGTYNLTAQNEAGCISPATVVIIEESAVAEPIGDTTKSFCTEDSTYDLFDLYENIDETGIWEDPEQTGALTGSRIDPSLLEVGNYSYNYVTGGNCPSTTTVAVTINDDCVILPCDFEDIKNSISKVVTPGTDTFNDFFIVDKERECGFTYGVQIFNRWGAEVYSSNNYDNNWNGYSGNSFTGSNQLPSGTYFYIIHIDGGAFEPIQGYIYLGTK